MSSPTIFSVWDLNQWARDILRAELGEVHVAGELTDVSRPASGHIYMTLKDSRAQIRAVLWRSVAQQVPFSLEDGLAVVCAGELDIYPPRGSYQLVVRSIVPQGQGALQLAFRQLHARLSAEGLFDPALKRPLPRFPSWIAVITSPTGAAVRDFLEVVRRRWPAVRVTVIGSRVQGAEAVAELCRGIEMPARWQRRPDVLVITRGGGSLEDLWCFNDECLVRAVRNSPIPVVSAVGHDIDVTLCDLAADLRCLTPTEAGERVVPDQREICQMLAATTARLRMGAERSLRLARERLARFDRSPALRRPLDVVRDRQRRLDELEQRCHRALAHRLRQAFERLNALGSRLESLSPMRVLARGYTVTWLAQSGQLVRHLGQLEPGCQIVTQLSDGRVLSQVQEQQTLAPSASPTTRPLGECR